jgi:hypothetical protein
LTKQVYLKTNLKRRKSETIKATFVSLVVATISLLSIYLNLFLRSKYPSKTL